MKLIYTFIVTLLLTSSVFAQNNMRVALEPPFLMELSVYPNPTSGQFNVAFTTIDAEERVTIKVFNLIGKEVYRVDISGVAGDHKERVDLHNAAKGIYVLEISNGDKKQTRRLSFI